MNQVSSSLEKRGERPPFCSILFDISPVEAGLDGQTEPDFLRDLNLDQIFASITTGREDYNLRPFFLALLNDAETIRYRQDVFRDLDNHALAGTVRSFAQEMQNMRNHLSQADTLYYKHQKKSWFLDAANIYCAAVMDFNRDLVHTDLTSRGLQMFRDYLTNYIDSESFIAFYAETRKIRVDLAEIRYSLEINGSRIKVTGPSSEPNYGADVLQTFDKFKQAATKEYRFKFSSGPEMNHVEAAILDLVSRIYPEVLGELEQYYNRHSGYPDRTICTFDREIQFYIAYIDHMEHLRQAGLHFCYPKISEYSKEVYGHEVFDLALANRLISEKTPMVTNDFYLKDPERIFVVSGPNQGGKTTFARMFGQLHYLAATGCPVPGKETRLFLFDKLFTHFEKEEHIQSLRGKLENDLIRIHRILAQATHKSILIMNESFISTTLSDALFLSKRIMELIIQRDMLCVSVTFLDELTSLSETIVSMVSTVQMDDPARRTFKVIRKPADGRAYALAIAEKYHLSYENIQGRIVP